MADGHDISGVTSVETQGEPSTGMRIGQGRYSLERKILSDPLGEIWLARDVQMNENMEIRFLRGKGLAEDLKHEQLHREIRAARRMSHPHVARIYDFCEAGESRFLVTEYFEGHRGSEIIGGKHQPCSPLQAAPLMKQVGDALGYLHQELQVHGCLHPAQIIVNTRGRIKLHGLGLLSVWQRVFATGAADYAAFISPQIRAGLNGCEADDLYSAGTLWFFLLTGKAPPDGPCDRECLIREQLGIVSAPVEHADLILKCLAENPDERPLSAADFLARLNASSPSSTKPETSPDSNTGSVSQPDSDPVPAPASRPATMVPDEPPTQFATSYRSPALPILFWSLVTLACLALGYWFNQHPFTPSKKTVLHSRPKSLPQTKQVTAAGGEASPDYAFIPITNRLEISTDAGQGRWVGAKSLWRQEGETIIGQAGESDDFNDIAWLQCQEPLRRDFELSFEFRGETHAGVAYRSEFRTNGVAGYAMRCDGPVVAGNLYVLVPRKARHELSIPGRKVSIQLEQDKDRTVVLGTMAKKEQLAGAWKAGEWNQYLIHAQGNRLVHQLNGITISDVTDNNPKRWVGQRLALYYSPRQTVGKTAEFRKLQIKLP